MKVKELSGEMANKEKMYLDKIENMSFVCNEFKTTKENEEKLEKELELSKKKIEELKTTSNKWISLNDDNLSEIRKLSSIVS